MRLQPRLHLRLPFSLYLVEQRRLMRVAISGHQWSSVVISPLWGSALGKVIRHTVTHES